MNRELDKIFEDKIHGNWVYYKYFNRPAGTIEIYRFSKYRNIYQKLSHNKFASVKIIDKFFNNSNVLLVTEQEARLWCLKRK